MGAFQNPGGLADSLQPCCKMAMQIQIAASIAQQQTERAEVQQLEQMVAELEEMPDDEVGRILLEESEKG